MKKTILVTLPVIQVTVEGNNENELIENAKKAVIEKITKEFPKANYGFADADSLDPKEAQPGTIIKDNKGILGIISSIKPKNKKPINATLKGNIDICAIPQALKLSDATFEEARSKRPDYRKDSWEEGETGYVKANDSIESVIVGAKKGKKRELWIINGKGKGFIVSEEQLSTVLKDEKEEVK